MGGSGVQQIAYEAACVSNTIKNMLSSQGQFTETELREIKFPEITTPILERVCQYFYYKLRYTNWCGLFPSSLASRAECPFRC